MKIKPVLAAITTSAAAAAFGVAGAAVSAADAEVQHLGQPAELVNGDVVQHWTVTGLKPSSDVIPYHPVGTLWEATATDEAIKGSITPIVSNLNARAANGDTYRVLFGVATEQGVNPATLAQGEKTTGKIYFDVTGASPDSVFYSSGGPDVLLWLEAPPAPATGSSGSGSTTPAYTGTSPSASGAAETTPADPAATPAAETPTSVAPTATPAPVSNPVAPLPEGSSGTPLPEGSTGTPLPEGSSGTPLPAGAAATPAEAGPAPVPAAVTPAPAGSAGTPLPQGAAPAAETPVEGVQHAPVPSAPTTTVVVPAPPA